MEWVAWTDEYAPTCPNCRALYAARTPPEEPPCATCRIELAPANQETGAVFMLARRQLIVAGDQAVDLSIPAVKIVMDVLGVRDQAACLQRVLACWHTLDRSRWKHAGG